MYTYSCWDFPLLSNNPSVIQKFTWMLSLLFFFSLPDSAVFPSIPYTYNFVPAATEKKELEAMRLHECTREKRSFFPSSSWDCDIALYSSLQYTILRAVLFFFFFLFFDTKSVLQVLVSSAFDKPLMEQPLRDFSWSLEHYFPSLYIL
jgi:hypothetical protein